MGKNLNYSCTGQGEYPRYEPEILVLGRESTELAQSSDKGSDNAGKSVGGSVSVMRPEQSALINDLFLYIFKKIDQTITGDVFGNFIEDMRDRFPPGPVLHQFMHFVKEIKTKFPEKLIIGSLRDDVLTKLKEFKAMYT